jgi:regulator of protease activity HflC (stomatin/prohibitin superfamily)
MKGLTTYLFFATAFVLVLAVMGVVGPAMVSARSTEMVLGGIVLVGVLPVAFMWLYRRWSRTVEGQKIVKKIMPVLLLAVMLGACSKVPAGNVGVIVNLYGSEKGVSEREVGVGKYWLGWNEELYLFPTFAQNDSWQRIKNGKDESITFQTGKDGMVMNADFGITFRVDPRKVTTLFQTYRKGVEEISDIYLRNLVRDAINERAAEYSADEAYGRKKNEIMDAVEKDVIRAVADKGIIVEKVYLIGEIRLPDQVRIAIDEKNRALQTTLQREQEIIKAKAEAEIKIAEARGRAESVLLEARAQSEANKLVAASITPELVRYRALDRWDGALPRLSGGGAVPFIDVSPDVAAGPKPQR